jgi:hypothetical protein
LNNFCNTECAHLNKNKQRCTKFDKVLPCNIKLNIFRCEECIQEEEIHESKNKIRNNH